MPVKTVTFGVSTTISAALRLLFTFPSSTPLTSPLFPVTLSLSASSHYLSLPALFCFIAAVLFFCNVLFSYKILTCIFSDVMHLPMLPVFIISPQTVTGQYFRHWLCSQFKIHFFHLYFVSKHMNIDVLVFTLCSFYSSSFLHSAHASLHLLSAC